MSKPARLEHVPSPANGPPSRAELPALEDLVGYRLRRLHGRFVEAWREFYGALGLSVTPVQGGILMLIARQPRLTQTELARLLQIEAPTLHESLKRLIELGLVRRESLARDRRAHALMLTGEGHAAADLIAAHIAEQEAEALAPLDAAERRLLAELLGRALAGTHPAGSGPG